MASLLDLEKKLKDLFNQGAKTVGKTVNNINPLGDTNPQQAGRQNFWTQQAAPAAQQAKKIFFQQPTQETSRQLNNFISPHIPKVPEPIVQGINRFGKGVGDQPLVGGLLSKKSPNIRQVAEFIGKDSPLSSFLGGQSEKIPGQFARGLDDSFGNMRPGESMDSYIKRRSEAVIMGKIDSMGHGKKATLLRNQSGRMSKIAQKQSKILEKINQQPKQTPNQPRPQSGLQKEGLLKSQESAFQGQPSSSFIDSTKKIIRGQGQLKDKSLAIRMRGSDRYPENIRKAIDGTYVGIRNKDTINTAKQLVRLDPQAAELRAMKPQNATDQAIGIELFNHYMDSGQVARANAIMNATSGTNEGQMVQILSQYDKSTPGGAVKFATNLVKNYNKAHPNNPLQLTDKMVQGFYKQAQKVQSMPEGKARNIAANTLINDINALVPSTIGDKAIAVWKAGLLTSFRTQERNLMGNTIHNLAEVSKDIPATLVDRALSLKTGKRSLTFTLKGIGSGGKQGIQQGKDILTIGYDPEQAINKYDVRQINWGNNPLEQGLKKYTDTVFRTLGASDKPFYSSAFARSLHDQAGAAAINVGRNGDAKFIQSLVKNPTTDMLKQATIDANTATFKNTNLLGEIAGKFKAVAAKNEYSKVASEILMPFTGVPSSIAGQMVAYSPIGLTKGIVNAGRVLAGGAPDLQRQATQEIGRGAMGTGLFGLGAYLTQKGLMTGQPKDQAEARQWELENKPRNSVLIDGKWRSINSIGPEFLVVLAGAKAQEEFNKGEEGSVGRFAANTAKDFLSQTFLQGVQGPLQAVNEPERYAKTYFGNQAASVIPNIIKDTAKSLDPWQRESNTAGDYFTNNLPIIRNQGIVKRDVLGNPLPQEPTGAGAFFDLFGSKTPNSNPVIDELSRLNKSGFNATPGKLQKTQTIRGEKIKLSPQQLNTLESELGPQAQSALSELFQTPDYQSLPDQDKSKAVDSLLESIRKQVRGNIDITQSPGNPGQIISEASAAEPKGEVYTLISESGTVKRIDLSKEIEAPKLTGNADLDKKLVSKYKGQLTARGNDIVALYQAGKIDAETAQKELEKLSNLSAASGGGKKGRKPKAVTIKSVSPARINFKNISKRKLPAVKISKAPVRTQPLRVKNLKITTPEKKVSYKIVGPSKARNTLDNSVRLV